MSSVEAGRAALGAPAGAIARAVPWACGAGAVLAQMVFPFTAGGTFVLTAASVVLFAAASVGHAVVHTGLRGAAAVVLVAGGGGLLAEMVGANTGVPFGTYAYTGTLGPELLGVPVLVALAWTMMAYPALVVGRRLAGGHGRAAVAGVAAWALASWDVFLDPQMVDAGHWSWSDPHPALPGVSGVPVSNFAGWLLVAAVLAAVLDRLVPSPAAGPAPDALPVALYLWTYASSVLAHAVFFGRPPVALAGGLAMGLVAVPLAIGVWRQRTPGRGRP